MSEGIKLTRDNKQGCVVAEELSVNKTVNRALLEIKVSSCTGCSPTLTAKT